MYWARDEKRNAKVTENDGPLLCFVLIGDKGK